MSVSGNEKIIHSNKGKRLRNWPLIFQLSQFISDIGGTLGLYVGASVLSLCEVLDLLLTLCAGKLCPRKNENYQGQQEYRNRTPEHDSPFADAWPNFNHIPIVNRQGPVSYQFRWNTPGNLQEKCCDILSCVLYISSVKITSSWEQKIDEHRRRPLKKTLRKAK